MASTHKSGSLVNKLSANKQRLAKALLGVISLDRKGDEDILTIEDLGKEDELHLVEVTNVVADLWRALNRLGTSNGP